MIRSMMRLFRLRLALLNGVAAAGGHCLFPSALAQGALWTVVAGVTLLAAGGSALNQVMERDIDRLMARTSRRPLPNGDLSPATATAIGVATLLAGLLVLGAEDKTLPSLLGAMAVAWYLGVYTPLKRHTPFALAVGGVCGAVPPVIGWCNAGGEPTDYRIMLLAGLLYLWQIPHFWLFQRRHAEEYRCAGIPLFDLRLPEFGTAGLCRLWLLALAAASLLLPAFGIIEGNAARWYLVVPVGLCILAYSRSEDLLGSGINLFPLLVTLALVFQR